LKLHALPFGLLRSGLDSREFSSVELAVSVLDRIEELEPSLSAFITLLGRPDVIAQAERADEELAAGRRTPLLGIPVAIKDNISTRGLRTTCGSAMLRDYVPPFDATAVARLRDAGAVLVGKTNMDEFAMGSSNETSAFGPTKNPWGNGRVPGGSSGGSAVAVAAREVPLALGSDTGGSVRQPAAFCGVVGLKPTYGRVSRYGLIAFASSLDQIGMLSPDVAGASALFRAVAGEDPRDSTTASEEVPSDGGSLSGDLSGVRVGVPPEFFGEGVEPDVRNAVEGAVNVLAGLGADVREVSIGNLKYGIPAYYLVADAEASSNLARYDGVKYGYRSSAGDGEAESHAASRTTGFGTEVKRRIMLGAFALSRGFYDDYYLKAQKVRTMIAGDFERAFARVDVVVAPTSPETAFGFGERSEDPVRMYLSDVFTVPASLAGIPAMSVPCGLDGRGLPIGLQLMADKFGERKLFRVAAEYESASEHHLRRPAALERRTEQEPERGV